jgi:N4-gp56 family major capsid protein
MADTAAATGLTVQQWDAKFFSESLNANIFKPFMGTATNSVIQVKEDLTKKPGDSVTYSLVNKLSGAGVTGSSTLEGNEEAMISRSQKVTVDQKRNAVRVPVLEDQFSAIPLREAAKDVLMDWSMELIRDDTISALGSILGVDYGSATETNKDIWMVDNADRVLIGGDVANYNVDHSAAVVALVANDVVTAASLSLMKRMAKTASPKIRPLKPRQGARTSDSYVYFANSLQIRDLVADTAFLQANREARQRGKLNPLFAGADYIWDNIAIYEVEDIPVYAEGAGGIDIAPSYLCGAQAIAHAWAKRPQSVEEEFDYKDKQGVAIRQWYAVEKMRFGSGAGDTDDQKDHGVVTQWCSAIAD